MRSLARAAGPSRFAREHAHEPTPTPYFILEDLFAHLEFAEDSHLLDVGCGTGRVLAYFADAGFPGALPAWSSIPIWRAMPHHGRGDSRTSL